MAILQHGNRSLASVRARYGVFDREMTTQSLGFALNPPFYLLLLSALLVGRQGSATPTFRLHERVSDADLESTSGTYASFVESPSLSGQVELSGVAKESVLPPFPARITFELELPPSAFLSVDLALVVIQRVTRARVVYAVEIADVDGAPITALTETLELRHANVWHPQEIDLTRWSGRLVRLTLVTRTSAGSHNVLWADRVQTVWGDAMIESRPWRHAVSTVDLWAARLETWATMTAAEFGLEQETHTSGRRFIASLFLGGILTLFVRGLYRRFGNSPSDPETFAGMFPVLTLTTLFVIYIVQSSLALSLGLIGALSIVRFRTAIKSPHELVYVFFCVSIGIALGADRFLLGAVSVLVISIFIYFTSRSRGMGQSHRWLLTVSGARERFFPDNGPSALDEVTTFLGASTIRRLDHHDDDVELHAIVTVPKNEVSSRLSELSSRLPGLDISYVDVDELL